MINACVNDTDVISFIFKSDTRASYYYPHLNNTLGLMSFMTLSELRQWTLVRGWGERRLRELESFLTQYHVIYADDYLCTIWAEIRRDAIKLGRPIDTADAWVAAVAVLYGVPLITNNRPHFMGVPDLTIISQE
jgi:tRNA(fMet)-specific endonuclease VapC